ncbi:MAG: helix-turn-helix domain-containing protein [Syntrophaceae bacterium]|nr:helix-turn-helix domain-containing protein [Syntrophaceae bacterium]
MEKDETTQRAAQEETSPVQDLKSLRESRGIQLKDIFEATRITVVNLEAIESGRFGKLPAPVIARSFIRNYAQAIGADEGKLLERYNRFLAESQSPPPDEAPIPPKRKSFKKWIVTACCLTLALLIAAAVLMLREPVKAPSPSSFPTAKPAETAAPTAPEPASSPVQTGTTTPPATPPAPSAPVPAPAPTEPAQQPQQPSPPAAVAATDGYSLVIEARDYTWIRLSEDQSQPYQVLLKPGERLERRASRSFDIDVGNAGGTLLIFQGKPLGPLGSPGQVVHLRLP